MAISAKSIATQRVIAAVGVVFLPVFLFGCREDPRKQSSYAPYESFGAPKSGPVVTLDGQVLDDQASPQQVAMAALKAIQEDYKATADRDPVRINKARKVLYQLSAPQSAQMQYAVVNPGRSKDVSEEDAIRAVNGWWALAVGFYTDQIFFEHCNMQYQIDQQGVVVSPHRLDYEGLNAKTGQYGWIRVTLVNEGGGFRVAGVGLIQKPQGAISVTQPASVVPPTTWPASAPATNPSSAPATQGSLEGKP